MTVSNISKLIAHYGSQEAWAKAWGVSAAAVSQWVAAGEIPPRRLLESALIIGESFDAVVEDGTIVLISKKRENNNE